MTMLGGLLAGFAGCRKGDEAHRGRRGELHPATAFDLHHAGHIAGSIKFIGAPPPRARIDMSADPYCASHHAGAVLDPALIINDNHTLRQAFIYIARGLGRYRFQPPAWPVELKQTGCMFAPRVLGIMAGQALQVSSQDATPHNVHFIGPAGADWNLALAPQAPAIQRRFPESAVAATPVEVVCNVHPWMRAWVGVRPNPYFYVTGRSGKYHFPPLPPGTYTVAAWQERLGLEQQQVRLAPDGHIRLNFQFPRPSNGKAGGAPGL